MTRKDFELIADIIKSIDNDDARYQIAGAFAARLSLINPRFNSARFYKACNAPSDWVA